MKPSQLCVCQEKYMLSLSSQCHSALHEIVDFFNCLNIPLNISLQSMLNEAPEHQRPRRGCGFTQASRFLSELINQPRSLQKDLRVFSEAGRRQIKKMLAACQILGGEEPKNINQLRAMLLHFQAQNPYFDEYIGQLDALESLSEKLELEESKIIGKLIVSILGFQFEQKGVAQLEPCSEKLAIGTCPEAERYFLEFSGGYLRRQGIVNIFTDESGEPLLVEKMNLGDSHSCITIKETSLNGICIPAGSLLGAKYRSLPIDSPHCADFTGAWLPVSVVEGFRYLRLTTLVVSPQNRERAFSNHLKRQLQGSPFFDPLNTGISDLAAVAYQQKPGF